MTSTDLTDRMAKVAKGGRPAVAIVLAEEPGVDESFRATASVDPIVAPRSARRATPRQKVTMDLDADGYEALREAAYLKRVPMADIMRTLVRLWQTDNTLAATVDQVLGVNAQ